VHNSIETRLDRQDGGPLFRKTCQSHCFEYTNDNHYRVIKSISESLTMLLV
jgi:hypothetical protein